MTILGLDLNTIWFFVIGLLLTVYVVLDGFDFGVGALYLFAKKEEERQILLKTVGPFWDGNEVWLVVGGGALFAAFPNVYATVFSGFYLAFILLLFALIFRAMAIECRNKETFGWWQKMWDGCFFGGSAAAAFIFGVALGNVVWGVPLSAAGEFSGTFLGLFHPYALLVGVTTLALFMTHGGLYLLLRTESKLQERIKRWAGVLLNIFCVCLIVMSFATVLQIPHMSALFRSRPQWLVVPFGLLVAVLNIFDELRKNRFSQAFISSCIVIVFLMILFGAGIFPNLVISNPDPRLSLTIYNAASSQKTLGIMLLMVACGMPFVIAYNIFVYWVFRGKVKLDSGGY